MPESIQIVVEAIEGNTAAIKNVQTQLTGIKTTTDQVTKQQVNLSKQFRESWTEINNMVVMAERGFRAIKQAVDETLGSFVEYADQVRTISQVTGASSEETSRLIQVTDDYKISADSLTQVMRKLAGEGLSLTIDSLAQLSDEYLELNDGTERQIFLTENFGRTGADFAEIMLQGSAAIRDQSSAISENLILSQEAIDKAREYEIASDSLADAVDGLKIALGAKLAPAFTEVTQAMAAFVNGGGATYYNLLMAIGAAMDKDWGAASEYFNTATKTAAESLQAAGFEMDATSEKTKNLNKNLDDFSGKIEDIPPSKQVDITVTTSATGDTYVLDWIISQSGGSGHITGDMEAKAGGGDFKGWAMVGDAPGGKVTPYTEWVYAPQGAHVYNQSQIGNVQAPPMAGGGTIPPVEGFDYDRLAIIVRDAVLLAV